MRPNDAFMVNCEGPTIEFLPAVPQCPVCGAVNAAGFRYRPGVAAYTAAPVVSGRILPVTPVPTTATAYTGVAGSPLPALIWLSSVHPLNAAPLQPRSSAPPCTPTPDAYCVCKLTRCR